MDNIIIMKGTNVVINKDVYAYKTLVAKKGLKVVCEKDIKKRRGNYIPLYTFP